MPRSTRTLEILTTYRDSHSRGCRSCSNSFASIASCTTRSISCRQRRIWHSSSARPRLVSYLYQELKGRAWEKKSRWTASAQARLASRSTRTSLSTHAKAPSLPPMRRRHPMPINKQKPATRQRSKPRRAPARSKDSLGRWRGRLEEASILARQDGNWRRSW
jgi:hypothetical protein